MMKQLSIIILLTIAIMGCNSQHVSVEKSNIGDTSFCHGYSKSYGAHYAKRGVEQNVIDLDLYSEKLDLDSTGKIVGTGTNLYISDIFLPSDEEHLLKGQYVSDSTCNAYSFLPGVDYEGNISGAYLLRIENGNLTGYTIFEEGSFVVEQETDSIHINFTLKYREYGLPRTYEAKYNGIIKDM